MDYHNLALFSDLDGTLLDSQRQVSRENRQALEHFIAGGGLFGISTGRAPLNALALLPGVPINTWSVVLNGAEAYRYQTGTVAFPRVLPQLRAAALVQWVLERLPRTQVLLCSESRLFFLSPRDLADPDFLRSHSPAPLPIWAPPWTIPGSRFCSPPPARTWSIWSSGPPTTEFWR